MTIHRFEDFPRYAATGQTHERAQQRAMRTRARAGYQPIRHGEAILDLLLTAVWLRAARRARTRRATIFCAFAAGERWSGMWHRQPPAPRRRQP